MNGILRYLEAAIAVVLALIWISPLLFAIWAAFHSPTDAMSFDLASPLTLENFRQAWEGRRG
jgi:sn-glycerol 3-phosphate transport system permease protein